MKKIYTFLLILFVFLVVSFTLFNSIPNNTKLIIRLVLIVVFFGLWRFFSVKNLEKFKDIAFALLALNIAFLIVSVFTSDFWSLDMETSKGFALSKLSDAIIISLILIGSFVLAGYKLKSIYITRGRLIPGLIIGTIFFLLFTYLALNNPQELPESDFLKNNYIWILVFVFANGFMEELVFRGIMLKKLHEFFNPLWSAAPHLLVNYRSDTMVFGVIVFVLGMLCGFSMHYSKSIIAPWLIHAGADLMIIIPVFATYGVNP